MPPVRCTSRDLRVPGAWLPVAAGVLLSASMSASAGDFGADIAKAVQDGKFNLGFRYRYEHVDEEPFTEDANASTLRTRLTWQSAALHDFSALLEMDDLRSVGSDRYNSTRNGETSRPVVPDPEATDLNQAAIRYTGLEHTDIVVGRQRIARGNERFIGPVGWRQNEQTLDAASVNYAPGSQWQFWYAYVSQVNRVFGPDSGTPPPDLTGNSHLMDVTWLASPAARLTAYGYFLDLEDLPALSSQTFGLRLAGDVALTGEWSIPYAVEYATQDDYQDNPNRYDADYYLAEAGVRWRKLTVKAALEVLEGGDSAGEAFQTPLATAHAFQGWADKFPSTPARGIEDRYVFVEYALPRVNLKARYDDFRTETGGSDDYGDEFGIWLTLPVGKHYSAALKYAVFNADHSPPAGAPADTDKFWVILAANF